MSKEFGKIPLAERLRPQSLDEWVGQEEVLSPGKPLYEAITHDRLFSFILYAPPGSGKTSLCQLIKKTSKNRYRALNAVSDGVKEVKAVIEEAKAWLSRDSRQSVVFIDEIHRFRKNQQDALLGAVERGEIILIGATTENPSHEINAALLSRARVFRMEALTEENLRTIMNRAKTLLESEGATIEDEAIERLLQVVHGDARAALNGMDALLPHVTEDGVRELLKSGMLFHDKHGDLHYQVVSAFIKSMRASQTQAALYYLARMWQAGEDPLFIARRMVIFASEDIGNADLKALALTNAVRHAVEFVGRPECYYALAQGVIYLSQAKKSRAVGEAFNQAQKLVRQYGAAAVPKFLVNAVTSLDRDLGRGKKRQPNESYLPSGLRET